MNLKRKFLFPFFILFVMACAVPGMGAPAPAPLATLPLGGLETAIAGTAGAAQTQTAILLPTATFTPSPTRTASVTPTPTVTFIYNFFTNTPLPSETPSAVVSISGTNAGGASLDDKGNPIFTGEPWTCRVTGRQPPMWTVVKANKEFFVYFTILNTGTKDWTINTIDFVYTGGYRHEGTKIQDLPRNAPSGGTVVVGARFIAPKKAGEYSSYFTLMVGRRSFCGMKISFVVEEK